MPFTPSHAAAVLPFLRTPLPPAGLVIGSMMPDLFYFLPVHVPRGFSHSLLGAVTLDLAVGAVLYVLWRAVFRRPVADIAPLWVRERYATTAEGVRDRRMPWAGFAPLLAAALLTGIATHLAWDAFTHQGWLAARLPALGWQAGPLPLYSWLQHLSSLAGTVVLAVWVLLWWRRTPPGKPAPSRVSRRARAAVLTTLATLGVGVGLVYWTAGIRSGLSPVDSTLVFRTVRLTLGTAGLFAVLASIVWWTLPSYSGPGYTDRRTATTLPSTSA